MIISHRLPQLKTPHAPSTSSEVKWMSRIILSSSFVLDCRLISSTSRLWLENHFHERMTVVGNGLEALHWVPSDLPNEAPCVTFFFGNLNLTGHFSLNFLYSCCNLFLCTSLRKNSLFLNSALLLASQRGPKLIVAFLPLSNCPRLPSSPMQASSGYYP